MKTEYQIPQYYKTVHRHDSNGRAEVYIALAYSLGQASAWAEDKAAGLGAHVEAISVIGQHLGRELYAKGARPILVNVCDYAPDHAVQQFNTSRLPGACGDRAHYTPWDPVMVGADRQAVALELWDQVRESVECFDDMHPKVISSLLYLMGAAVAGSYCDFAVTEESPQYKKGDYYKQIRAYLHENPDILAFCTKHDLII